MATIAEILRMPIEERKALYGVSAKSAFNGVPIGIESVIIDGNRFTDYGAFSFLWEKSYVTTPERAGDGSIENLNAYPSFITPHLKIDFSIMSIDSYRTLMRLLYGKNEHAVECYDVVNDGWTVNNMYFATEEMPKLWNIVRALNGEEWVELLGVQDYTVELIGTNSNFKLQRIRYYLNPPNLEYNEQFEMVEQTFKQNTSVIIGANASQIKNNTFGGAYSFNGWNTKANGTGTTYIDGEDYYLTSTIQLYAQWKKK